VRPGATHVVSGGSNWWFDEDAMEYLRLPKVEQPRERPEWGSPDAGPLEDAKWHTYVEWWIEDTILWIRYSDDRASQCIRAPRAEVLT
jgi:hypothetical protein